MIRHAASGHGHCPGLEFGPLVARLPRSSRCIQTFPDFEVVVVDSGSTDGATTRSRRQVADAVDLLWLPKNRGFAVAVNAGIRHSESDFRGAAECGHPSRSGVAGATRTDSRQGTYRSGSGGAEDVADGGSGVDRQRRRCLQLVRLGDQGRSRRPGGTAFGVARCHLGLGRCSTLSPEFPGRGWTVRRGLRELPGGRRLWASGGAYWATATSTNRRPRCFTQGTGRRCRELAT